LIFDDIGALQFSQKMSDIYEIDFDDFFEPEDGESFSMFGIK
jgi:hypothetical protein